VEAGASGIPIAAADATGRPRCTVSDREAESDKHYWHRYTETYRRAFAALGDTRRVVEFGVQNGASISWLAECFPGAEIIGADILPAQPGWPADARISYRQIDQADRAAVKTMLAGIAGHVDLIIDDGSHIPQHQASCLAEGMPRIRGAGLYILEDISTSHPLQSHFAHHSIRNGRRVPNALNVLLAIQHLKDSGGACGLEQADALAAPGFFSRFDVRELFAMTARVEIYKRTQLPLRCHGCGGNDFDYVAWLCRCGAELYHPADSITALVWKC
jgi:predicted O-methyltransferase YrrM